MNVCPECEKNVLPRTHPSLRANAICKHRLMEMSGAELLKLFPAAAAVFADVLHQSQLTTQEKANVSHG